MTQLSRVFCTECGIQNLLGSNFCFRCGNQLQKDIIKDNEETNNTVEAQKARKTPNQTSFVQQSIVKAYNTASSKSVVKSQSSDIKAPGQCSSDQEEHKAETTDNETVRPFDPETHLRFDAPMFVPIKKEEPKAKAKAKKRGESKDSKSDKETPSKPDPWMKWLVNSLSSGKENKDKEKEEDKEDQDEKQQDKDKEERAEGSKNGYCRYYGSAKGCESGDQCIFSHSNPNSVPFCKYFNIEWGEGCPWTDKCKFRHQNFDAADGDQHRGEKEVLPIRELKNHLVKLAHLHSKQTDIGVKQEEKQEEKQLDKEEDKPEEKPDEEEEEEEEEETVEQGETKGWDIVKQEEDEEEEEEEMQKVEEVEEAKEVEVEVETAGGFSGWNAW